jgi:hypothetical protein
MTREQETQKVRDAFDAVCRGRVEAAVKAEPVAWRNAALRVGEDLCSVGPFGYYDMTAEQWLDWALSVVTVHAPPAAQLAVFDAITDRSESPEYIQGWNDCRAEMLKGMKP